MHSPTRIIVTDANVLINFISVERLYLLGKLPTYDFVVPDEVKSEVKYPEQRQVLQSAIDAGVFQEISVNTPSTLEVFAELSAIMGRGEAACLALAVSNDWIVASDEKRAVRREVQHRLGENHLVTTAGLFVLCIRSGLITVKAADEAKILLEQRRFKMKFNSFYELL